MFYDENDSGSDKRKMSDGSFDGNQSGSALKSTSYLSI